MTLKSKKILSLVLSFLIFALPFSSMAYAGNQTQAQDRQMPCHQHADDKNDNFCPETGVTTCECCEFAMPAALTLFSVATSSLFINSSTIQETYLEPYNSQSTPPPFRPPRYSI